MSLPLVNLDEFVDKNSFFASSRVLLRPLLAGEGVLGPEPARGFSIMVGRVVRVLW